MENLTAPGAIATTYTARATVIPLWSHSPTALNHTLPAGMGSSSSSSSSGGRTYAFSSNLFEVAREKSEWLRLQLEKQLQQHNQHKQQQQPADLWVCLETCVFDAGAVEGIRKVFHPHYPLTSRQLELLVKQRALFDALPRVLAGLILAPKHRPAAAATQPPPTPWPLLTEGGSRPGAVFVSLLDLLEAVLYSVRLQIESGALSPPAIAAVVRSLRDARLGDCLASLLAHVGTQAADTSVLLAQACAMAASASSSLLFAAVGGVGPLRDCPTPGCAGPVNDAAALVTARELGDLLLPVLSEKVVYVFTQTKSGPGCLLGNVWRQGMWRRAAGHLLSVLQAGHVRPETRGTAVLLTCLLTQPSSKFMHDDKIMDSAVNTLSLWLGDCAAGVDGPGSSRPIVDPEAILLLGAAACAAQQQGIGRVWGVSLTLSCVMMVRLIPPAPAATAAAAAAWSHLSALSLSLLAANPPTTEAAVESANAEGDSQYNHCRSALVLLEGCVGRGVGHVAPRQLLLGCGGEGPGQILCRIEVWLRAAAFSAPDRSGDIALLAGSLAMFCLEEAVNQCCAKGQDSWGEVCPAIERPALPCLLASVGKCLRVCQPVDPAVLTRLAQWVLNVTSGAVAQLDCSGGKRVAKMLRALCSHAVLHIMPAMLTGPTSSSSSKAVAASGLAHLRTGEGARYGMAEAVATVRVPAVSTTASAWDECMLDMGSVFAAHKWLPPVMGCWNRGCTNLASPSEATGRKRCGGCQLAGYCSAECQRSVWLKSHRGACKKFEAKRNAAAQSSGSST